MENSEYYLSLKPLDDFSLYEGKDFDLEMNNNSFIDINFDEEDIVREKLKEEIVNRNENKKIINSENILDEKTGSSSKFNFEVDKVNEFHINPRIIPKINKYIKDTTNKKKGKNKAAGRKRNGSNEKGVHNKSTDDNLIIKCKRTVVNVLFIFINNLLKNLYKNSQKKLLKINQSQFTNSTANSNREFLVKKIKDIFSDKISTKFTRYKENQNEILIDELLNQEEENKRLLFEKIFNLTFLDCLNHFLRKIKIRELEGLITLYDKCEIFEVQKEDSEYIEKFKDFMTNFESIIMHKKGRNRNKIKNDD